MRREMRIYVREGVEVKLASSIFWNGIFVRFYSACPKGRNDARWDTLLHQLNGQRLLAQHLGINGYRKQPSVRLDPAW